MSMNRDLYFRTDYWNTQPAAQVANTGQRNEVQYNQQT